MNKKTLFRFLRLQFRLEKEEEMEDTYKEILSGAEFSGYNLWILGFAMIIACIGLNNNSVSAIIGAMLISPLMGPIIGYATGLALGDNLLKRRAIRNWIWMTVISLAASSLYFVLTPITHNTESLSSFMRASLFDIMIAFFGGLAGFVGIIKRDGVKVLAGVSVATACMPPLCTAGFGLAHLDYSSFLGGLYYYLINCLYIGLATFLMARIYGMHLHFQKAQKMSMPKKLLWYTLILAMLIPSSIIFYRQCLQERQNPTIEYTDAQRIDQLEKRIEELEKREN